MNGCCLAGPLIALMIAIPAFAEARSEEQSEDQRFAVAGRVMDELENPITEATVHIVGLPARMDLRHFSPGSQIANSPEGRYEIAIDSSDRRLRLNREFLVVAEAPGKRTVYRKLSHNWLHSRQPLDFRLNDQQPLAIRILNQAGKPVSGVRVSAAKVGTQVVPFRESTGSVLSDEDGVATLDGHSGTDLRMIYAVVDSGSHQCLSITATADRSREAVLFDTKTHDARLVFPDDSMPAALPEMYVTITAASGESDKADYTWSRSKPDANGQLRGLHLSDGTMQYRCELPENFPFAVDVSAALSVSRPQAGEPIEIAIVPAVEVKGQTVRSDTGGGIANVYIDQHDCTGRHTFSDADGHFRFWAGKGRIGYFPLDTFNEFAMAGAFYVYPQELPEDRKLVIKPVQLQPAPAAVGLVVDETGSPVAGAKVQCSYKRERFTQDETYYSNADGEFRFLGISDGTGVSVSARHESRMTVSGVTCSLSPDARPKVVIEPRHSVRLTGRVVDYGGHPVAGASVRVRYSKAHQEEGYSGSRGHMADLFDGGLPIETDQQGRFVSPPILDWEQQVALSVEAAGQSTLNTYLVELKEAADSKDDYDFGELEMRPRPMLQAQTFRVVDDSTGDPIPGARVIAIGASTPRSVAITDDDGRGTVTVSDRVQLIGADSDSHQPSIDVLQTAGAELTIRLSDSALPPDRVPVAHDVERMHAGAEQLLQLLPVPKEGDTVHRQRSFAFCLAYADFERAMKKLASSRGLVHPDMVGFFVSSLTWLSPEQKNRVVDYCDDRGKLHLLLKIAEDSADAEKREELIGEALVLARELRGDDHAYAITSVAESLLTIGQVDLAVELLQDAWQEHAEFAQVLEDGERARKRGIARTFAPAYAMVDADAALKLIELTAYADEIERLQTKALVYLALFQPKEFERQRSERNISELSPLGINQFFRGLKVRNLLGGLRVAKLVPDSPGKAQFLLDLVRNAQDATDEQKLIVARLMRKVLASPSAEASMVNTSQLAAEMAAITRELDPALAEEFAFLSLWLCEHENLILPFNLNCRLSIALAEYDQTLARALIEPCFEDWSWLLSDRDDSVIYSQNMPLVAAATIDPDWAVEKSRDLLSGDFKNHPSRKYETVYGIVNQWGKLETALHDH